MSSYLSNIRVFFNVFEAAHTQKDIHEVCLPMCVLNWEFYREMFIFLFYLTLGPFLIDIKRELSLYSLRESTALTLHDYVSTPNRKGICLRSVTHLLHSIRSRFLSFVHPLTKKSHKKQNHDALF